MRARHSVRLAATRTARREASRGRFRGASNAVLIGVASSLSSSFSSVCEVSSRGSSSTRFSRGLAERRKATTSVRSATRLVARSTGTLMRRERRGLRTGGWTRAAYAALGSRPRGGRSADPRASARRFAPSERTTASPDDAIRSRAAREYRAARSTRYARVDRHRSETRDRTSRRSPPRTRVWTGPRPPHSETWRAARDGPPSIRRGSYFPRISRNSPGIKTQAFLKQADEDDSSSTENELGITNERCRDVSSRANSSQSNSVTVGCARSTRGVSGPAMAA